MENSQSKYLLVLGLILIIGGGFYLFNLNKQAEAPYQVLSPEGYAPGTTISLYANVPPGFPTQVILEGKPLSYAGIVAGASAGKTQTKVSYESSTKVTDLLPVYKDTLTERGWTVFVNSSSAKAAALVATRDGKNVFITIADSKQAGTDFKSLVTFQYDNN